MAKTSKSKDEEAGVVAPQECFVIMPISDPDGYEAGHFKRVYDLIFEPACRKAGFIPKRADEVKETNLIQLDILKRILSAPMALCDLSTRNPNVLFELGIRQAFDKPVTLVQEQGTPRIFDISQIRALDYRSDLRADHVPGDTSRIADTLRATFEASERGDGVNSIVRLLSLESAASIPSPEDVSEHPLLERILVEVQAMRFEERLDHEYRRSGPQVFRELGALENELELIESEVFQIERRYHADGQLGAAARTQLRNFLNTWRTISTRLNPELFHPRLRSTLHPYTQRADALRRKIVELLDVARSPGT